MPIDASQDRFARLVATVDAPLDLVAADVPQVVRWADRRLLVQRGDAELAVLDFDKAGTVVRFPAPWSRRYGTVAVSPGGDVAVFAGVHALRAVDSQGTLLWERRHGCWSAVVCAEEHLSFSEYADDEDHARADSGSAAFSADGGLVWAHVRRQVEDDVQEEWLVLDAGNGQVLGRASTGTVGSASFQLPHPDSSRMGMSVAQGEETSPVLWGHWDGAELSVRSSVDEVLLDVGPSGERFLITDTGQWGLYLNGLPDGGELRRLNHDTAPSELFYEGDERVWWDFEGAMPDDGLAIVGTEHPTDLPRHWLVGLDTMTVRGRVRYPRPVSGSPRPAGKEAWWTLSADRTAVHLWSLPDA
ncbi:hypothetical protein [Actinomadura oligospora]|uniref:hypothetical protein n=1 Tax=Actinomadura oligospora TaxID=111804 RepID=UPI0004788276|nr:hypothetical protein [Actinomadura oligospora]